MIDRFEQKHAQIESGLSVGLGFDFLQPSSEFAVLFILKPSEGFLRVDIVAHINSIGAQFFSSTQNHLHPKTENKQSNTLISPTGARVTGTNTKAYLTHALNVGPRGADPFEFAKNLLMHISDFLHIRKQITQFFQSK